MSLINFNRSCSTKTKDPKSKTTKSKGLCRKNACYGGPSESVVLASVRERLESVPYLEEYESVKEEVQFQVKKFVHEFFQQMERFGDTVDPAFQDACKDRDKDLFIMETSIIKQDCYTEFVLTVKDKVYDIEDLKYIPSNYQIQAVHDYTLEGDESYIIDVFTPKHSRPKMYRHLAIAMLKLSVIMHEVQYTNESLFSGLKDLAGIIKEFAQIYNWNNPDDADWYRQELSTYILLADPEDWIHDEKFISDLERYKVFDLEEGETFNDRMRKIYSGEYSCNLDRPKDTSKVDAAVDKVLGDIKKAVYERLHRRPGKVEPYLEEMVSAIVSVWRYCHSPFEDRDYYIASTSDAASIPELKGPGSKMSIIKSILEIDPCDGCEFDEATGYTSHYNKRYKPKNARFPWVITIHIPNPGKYKTRAIHLALSAIQDRCNYIHHRLAALLSRLPSDCTREQTRGISFILTLTDPYRREGQAYSILAYDWSNATDRLLQKFQEDCLGLVFDEKVVKFWHSVSSCEKIFKFKDHGERSYHQANGQPQGLLGSFEAFALAHHIMMLVTMYMSHRTEYRASEFYRVLGDDSVLTSISTDLTNEVGECYCQVCHWANVKVNRTKSTEILAYNSNALIEFAKVYAYNGEYFSPVPFRLATQCGKPSCDYYSFAAALWMQRHGGNRKNWISGLIDKYYPKQEENKIARNILFSGFIKSYADLGPEFQDIEMLQSDYALFCTLGYLYSSIKSSFCYSMLSDKAKEKLGSKTIKEEIDALEALLPKDLEHLLDRLEDNDHKFLIALQANQDREDLIKALFNDLNSDQCKLLAATLQLGDEFTSTVREIVDLYNTVLEFPKTIDIYRQRIAGLSEKIEVLGLMNYRSVYKRDTRNSMVLRSSIEAVLKILPPELCVKDC